jgi:hypothetical protein
MAAFHPGRGRRAYGRSTSIGWLEGHDDDPNDDATLRRVKVYQPILDALAARLGSSLKTIVLFGSQARGDATPESDHDFLVVASDLPLSVVDRQRLLRTYLIPVAAQLPGTIAFVARTPDELRANLSPLLVDVCADGYCLVGAEYFEPLRARALAAITQSGLQRRRVGGTLMWVFPQPHLHNWRLDWDGFHDRV